MDPSTFRVMFDLVNMDSDAAKELRPLGGPGSFFRRMRVLCGGQVVEDIDNYNRVHQMFSFLTAEDSSKNVDAEAFGMQWDIRDNKKSAYDDASFPGIPGNQSQTVLFKPLSGLLNQPKYLPIRYCPLTIELDLLILPMNLLYLLWMMLALLKQLTHLCYGKSKMYRSK